MGDETMILMQNYYSSLGLMLEVERAIKILMVEVEAGWAMKMAKICFK